MNKILLLLIFLFISNCSLNKVVKHHGVHYLGKKQEKLVLNKSNTNDIVELLGPASTKSTFDNDVWIYIERKNVKQSFIKLGKKKMLVNNVLILEIDNKGLLAKKDFFDIDNMKSLKFTEQATDITYSKQSFVYDFLSSIRQKMNDPLGKKKRKNN